MAPFQLRGPGVIGFPDCEGVCWDFRAEVLYGSLNKLADVITHIGLSELFICFWGLCRFPFSELRQGLAICRPKRMIRRL